jgi:hypothetical protein
VIVVDASEGTLFERHRRAWGGRVTHLPPNPNRSFLMPKVDGVLTGIDQASFEKVVIADDDVRYDRVSLLRISALLENADLVWPQNYFDPVPWHARWDTARTLLNRAFSHDYPGTVGVRRSILLRARGYNGDVMFENLELRRTIQALGGAIHSPLDLYVRRLPPTTRHFFSQRVRQAYDDFALPFRMAAFLSVIPLAAAAGFLGAWPALLLVAAGSVGLAEVGRRRAGGTAVFPAGASLLAPAWIAERSITSWMALWQRVVHGGVAYNGNRIRMAATSLRDLRRRLAPVGLHREE